MVKTYKDRFDQAHAIGDFDKKLVGENRDRKLVGDEDRAAAGKEIVGRRIAVYWARHQAEEADAGWWNGTVTNFLEKKEVHKIQFDDGQQALEHLSRQHWELIETPVPEKPTKKSLLAAWLATYYSDKQKEVRRQVAGKAWANRKAAAFLNQQKRQAAEQVSCLPIPDFPTRVPSQSGTPISWPSQSDWGTPISWPSQSYWAPQSLGAPHSRLLALPILLGTPISWAPHSRFASPTAGQHQRQRHRLQRHKRQYVTDRGDSSHGGICR